MTSHIEPEAPNHAFSFTDTQPVAECAYCRSDFRQRKGTDEFGDKVWVGDFCSGLCRKLWFEERKEKKL